MKINCKQTFKNLKNEDIQIVDGNDQTKKEILMLGNVIAEILLQPHKEKKGFRPLKSWELAQRFYKDKEVEIDQADFIQLKEIVEENENYNTIIIAQTLVYFNQAEQSKK